MGGFTAEEMLLFTWDTPDSATESDLIAALETLGADPAAALKDLRISEPSLTVQQIARKLREYEIFVGPGLDWLQAAPSLPTGWTRGASSSGGAPRRKTGAQAPTTSWTCRSYSTTCG
jgi:hypothetical protein